MQRVDYLIVGQGIAGTLLADALLNRGCTIAMIDGKPVIPSASEQAGGVLHAGAGNTFTPDPFFTQCLDFALRTYREWETRLHAEYISTRTLLLFRDVPGLPDYLRDDQDNIPSFFHNTHTLKQVHPVYQFNVGLFLSEAAKWLGTKALLIQEEFDTNKLEIHDNGVEYAQIQAKAVICCEGISAMRSRYFNVLPFIKNRGDILHVHIPDLPRGFVYENKVRLVERPSGLWWCGSNHQWNYTDLHPNKIWRKEVVDHLHAWLKVPFEIRQHTVGERPTTAGQFPLIGMHPSYPRLGIFNGLGTRGLTLAPWYAAHVAKWLCGEIPEIPGYPRERFLRWLK